MRERKEGRPPSYPSVVTTTTTAENIHGSAGTTSGDGLEYPNIGDSSTGPGVFHVSTSASSDVSAGGGANVETPVISLESALGIYQRRKDAQTSLTEYLRACDYHDGQKRGPDGNEGVGHNGMATTSKVSGENTRAIAEVVTTSVPFSRRHNEAVLAHLSMLRSRRRRRPTLFDVTSFENLAPDNSTGGGDNKTSSEKSEASSDDLALLLSNVFNISCAGSPVNDINPVSDAPLDSESMSCNGSSDTSKSMQRKMGKRNAESKMSESSSLQLSRYNRLVAAYNLCLTRFASGKYAEGLCDEVLVPFLREMSLLSRRKDGEGVDEEEDLSARGHVADVPDINDLDGNNHHMLKNLAMTTRLGFLVLDCFFAHCCGNGRYGVGISPIQVRLDEPSYDSHNEPMKDDGRCAEGVKMTNITANSILSWIEKNSLQVPMSERNRIFLSQYDLGYHELKFNLHVYRSKVLFVRDADVVDDQEQAGAGAGLSQSGSGSNGDCDLAARARTSRKELKSAMEIYQNKLCIEEEMKDQYDIGLDYREKESESGKTYGRGGKLSTWSSESDGGRRNSISAHRRNNSNGKYHTQDGSETTSVTSMAGGSFVTSISDALWGDGKGVAVPRATFEGMPNKLSNAQKDLSLQHQGHVPSMQPPSHASGTMKKKDNPDLEAMHELALFLKGNLEYLRGNTAKSLKLCIEARSAGKKSLIGGRNEQNQPDRNESVIKNNNLTERLPNTIYDQPKDKTVAKTDLETQMINEYDEAIYFNNLALVHQAEGKVHIASHYYSFALRCMERVHKLDGENLTPLGISDNPNFWSDGVGCPNISAEILNNASICAFQANNFKIAFECTAACVTISPDVFGKRARCWLRMGQSSIGIHAQTTRKDSTAKRQSDLLNSTITTFDDSFPLVGENETASAFRSNRDLTIASENPLQRASFCLQRAMHLSNANIGAGVDKEDKPWSLHCSDDHCFETSVLSLAYVKLELERPNEALELCRLLLGASASRPQNIYDEELNRNRAIAKVYSCEAMCRLGNSQGSIAAIFDYDYGHDIDRAVESFAEDIFKEPAGSGAAQAQHIAHSTVAGSLACAGNYSSAAKCASLISSSDDPCVVFEEGYPEDSFLERRVRLFSLLNRPDT